LVSKFNVGLKETSFAESKDTVQVFEVYASSYEFSSLFNVAALFCNFWTSGFIGVTRCTTAY